jgi:hypothetical protein
VEHLSESSKASQEERVEREIKGKSRGEINFRKIKSFYAKEAQKVFVEGANVFVSLIYFDFVLIGNQIPSNHSPGRGGKKS